MQSLLMGKGIRISDDDPIFTLLVLNEVVLEDMTKKHQQALNSARAKPQFPNSTSSALPASFLQMAVTAITSVGVGVAIGSGDKYMMLVGVIGIIIGSVCGFLVAFYSKRFGAEPDVGATAEEPAYDAWAVVMAASPHTRNNRDKEAARK